MASIVITDPPWAARPGMAKLLRAVDAHKGATRVVGGAVRDTLAGQPVKDIDMATVLIPEEVMARLATAKIKAVPTGLAHGTITAVVAGAPIEITTLRQDVETDGRHATIAHTDDWEADAARRDFTINALYADPWHGSVFDYFGGVEDLEAGRVRFIGDPLRRIAEDHLRILRFFRFQARFGKGDPDPQALAACCARANDLMALSRERIAQELLALLKLPSPEDVVSLMVDAGILKPVLPEVSAAAPLAALVALEAGSGDPVRRLAALFPADPSIAEAVGARLKLSKAQRKRLVAAARRMPGDGGDPMALAYWHGVEAATDRLLLGGTGADCISDWTPPKFPLNGGAIVGRGVRAGPEVARILKVVEQHWVDEGFPAKERVDEILVAVLKA